MSKFKANTSSFKHWMKSNFTKDQMSDMVNHGVNCGYPGLTYYNQTAALYRKYHDDIWEMLNDDAENMGLKHPLELIATFSWAENVVDNMRFENLMVWYAAEKVAYEVTES